MLVLHKAQMAVVQQNLPDILSGKNARGVPGMTFLEDSNLSQYNVEPLLEALQTMHQ